MTININYDDLFNKAMEDWGKFIDLNKPVPLEDIFDIEEEISTQYFSADEEILINTLHWTIFIALKEKKRKNGEGNIYMKSIKSLAKKFFVKHLKLHIKSYREESQGEHDWNAHDIALAKAYLEANK